MVRNIYYLIAKEKDSPKFKIISINKKDIYMYDEDAEMRSLSLPKIDLFSARFNNEEDLVNYLVKCGKLDNSNYSLYVGKRTNKDISFLNVLYGNNSDFLSIGFNADHGIMDSNKDDNIKYLDNFYKNIWNDYKYRNFILFNLSNIPNKFVKSIGVHTSSFRDLCGSKYDSGGWAITSYPLIRSLEESKVLFDKYKKGISDDIGLIDMKKLMIETDKNYDPNQFNMFDLFDIEEEKGYQYVKGRFGN